MNELGNYEGVDEMDAISMMDPDLVNAFGVVDIVLNVFMLLAFVGMGYGIYVLAKKMGIKHAWMGWIPLAQYYTMCKVAGVSFFKHIIVPFLVFLALIIAIGVIAAFVFGSGMDIANMGVGLGILAGLLYISAYVFYIIRYIGILSPISKKTGRGGWTTAGLFFIPFVMFPVVAHKYKGEVLEEGKEDKNIDDKVDSVETIEQVKEKL